MSPLSNRRFSHSKIHGFPKRQLDDTVRVAELYADETETHWENIDLLCKFDALKNSELEQV